jgi:hypothetical protein
MSAATRTTVLSPEFAQIAGHYASAWSELVPVELREEYLDAPRTPRVHRSRSARFGGLGREWLRSLFGFGPATTAKDPECADPTRSSTA